MTCTGQLYAEQEAKWKDGWGRTLCVRATGRAISRSYEGKICPGTPLECALCERPLKNRINTERDRSTERIC